MMPDKPQKTINNQKENRIFIVNYGKINWCISLFIYYFYSNMPQIIQQMKKKAAFLWGQGYVLLSLHRTPQYWKETKASLDHTY